MDRRKTFAPELAKTAGAFRAELGEFGIEAYWEAFCTETDADFARACRLAREQCEFMPTIRELRRFLPDRTSRKAIEATDRYIRQQQLAAAKAHASWPARIGPQDPTPVAELVGQYLDTKH